MTTSSALIRAGVAGWPIEHSRSPMIHQYWFDLYGIDAGYERFPVPPGAFAEFAARIGKDGLVGSNVTAPHKVTAFAACDRQTPVAQALGAVNTLWREDGLLWGDNTDAAGFLGNLDDSAPGWDDRRRLAVVVGAGGAARAIVYALVERDLEHILIVNRTLSHAQDLAAAYGDRVLAAPWDWLDAAMTSVDLLVNTSVLGMEGRAALSLDLGELPEHAVVADIVYVPLRTPLIEAARARGLRTAEGLGMLLHQSAPSFERWFGRRPEVTPELRVLVEEDVKAAHKGHKAKP